MLLAPRYDDRGFLRFDLDVGDVGGASIRQRRRLADLLAAFDDEQWLTESRCASWTSRDVVDHLTTTNNFWALSIGAGLAGEPTRMLSSFDPVTSPPALLDRARSTADVLAGLVASNEALDGAIAAIDDWDVLAEGPPGHVPVTAVVAHALWDAWVHERDILLPLGLEPVVAVDEVRVALIYSAALSPLFAVSCGAGERGALMAHSTNPEVRVVVEVDGGVRVHDGPAPDGALIVAGDAVDLVEALSHRAELDVAVEPDQRWLLAGLARVFDVEPA